MGSDTGFSFGDDRERKTDDVDSFLQYRISHSCCKRGVADHYGSDRVFTWQNVESILRHCRTEVLCILAKLLSELIRNDGILITQQSFKQSAVGIKTRSVKNRVVSPEETLSFCSSVL